MVFMTARIVLCGSAEDRSKYVSLWIKHFHEHKMELLGGAMPVFIAATIAEAVGATFAALTHNGFEATIWLTVIWALILCQGLAYYVVYFLPKSLPSYNFWYRISMENCAFMWKEALYLIIYYKYMYMYAPSTFTLIWVGFLIMCALVACTGLIQEKFTGAGTASLLKAKILNAEVYSLGLAYTLNLITLASACGPDFLTSIKSDDDHYHQNANPMCYPTLVLYPLIVTGIVTVLHSMGLFDTAAGLVHQGEMGEDEKEIDEMHHRQTEVQLRLSLAAEATEGQENGHSHGHGHGHRTHDDCYTRTGGMLTAACAPLDFLFCSWDRDRTASTSVSMMLYVMLGLYCGSAWFVYALLQFRFILAGPAVISYTVFSIIITFISLIYLTSLSTRHEWDHDHNGDSERWTNTKSKRKELVTMAAR